MDVPKMLLFVKFVGKSDSNIERQLPNISPNSINLCAKEKARYGERAINK